MTKNRQYLHRVNSPIKSPRRHNSSLRKKALVRRISGEVQFGASSKANLKVVVRVRPQNQREIDKDARCVVDVLDEHMLIFDPKEDVGDGFFFRGTKQRCRDLSKRQPLEKKFIFEHVFGEQSTNAELYEVTAHPLIDTLLQGYNCSVFAYGATGAGKTFTMLGRAEAPGITSLTLQELYQRLDALKGEKRCEVAVSYLEVYNETVRDLLGNGKPLALQEKGQQVMVPGLSLHKPTNAEELLQMLAEGNSNRTQHATDANAESSRSHAVFQIFVRQQDLDASAKATLTISKLSMIDLAGSERGAATGYRGVRFKEGSSINKSLLALGNCINALADGQRHIPYRDSKLTRLLKDSLGGNCRSVMIAAMSPASTTFEDTYNTLRYADRAKTIRTTIRNNVKNVDQHVSDYIKVVAGLKEEVSNLREKLKEYQTKEEEWEVERSALKAATVTTQPSHSPQDMEDQRVKEEEALKEENEGQNRLRDVSAEQKALRQELLQLEALYKATELKQQHWVARLARVKIVAFASSKLDKTLNKCERTIHTLDVSLAQTANRIEAVKHKVAANLVKMQKAQEALSCFGSKDSQNLIDRQVASIALRDGHHLGQHLQTLLRMKFQEQHTSEQLVHVLLGAVSDLYMQLYQKDQSCPEARATFQHVVEGLDECRIVWADQQEGDGVASSSQPAVAQLNPEDFTSLPSLTTPIISPTIMVEPPTSFRKSSLMASVNGSVVPHHHPAGNSLTSTTSQPRPVSPPPPVHCHHPLNTAQEKSLNTTTTLPSSPVFSHTTPLLSSSVHPAGAATDSGLQQDSLPSARTSTNTFLNTTYESVPSASQLSSLTVITASPAVTLGSVDIPSSPTFTLHSVNHPSSQARPLNTTIDIPSTGSCFNASPAKLFNTTAMTALNLTIDIKSPLTQSILTPLHVGILSNERLRTAHSETKLNQRACSVSQLSSADAHLPAPVTSVSLASTTSTVAPVVVRKLFLGDQAGLDSTFNIAQVDSVADHTACPPSSGPHHFTHPEKEAPSRSPCAVSFRSTTARSPLVPVTNRASHSSLHTIAEKQCKKAPLVRGFRGISNRRGVTRTPHKSLASTLTPGKGLRRSTSTPSLLTQQASIKPVSTTKRKLIGFGGTLQRTTSFLKGKTTNQENVPPHHTRRTPGMLRPTSPASHSRSPGPLGKA